MEGDFGSAFFLIIAMLAVLLGAYFTTKFISGKHGRFAKGKYINVIDRTIIAKDKQVLLLEVGDKHFLIGVTNQSVNVIGTIGKEALAAQAKPPPEQAQKGVAAKIVDFFVRAKDTQTRYNEARTQQKAKRKKEPGGSQDDYIEQISQAIVKRKDRFDEHKKRTIE